MDVQFGTVGVDSGELPCRIGHFGFAGGDHIARCLQLCSIREGATRYIGQPSVRVDVYMRYFCGWLVDGGNSCESMWHVVGIDSDGFHDLGECVSIQTQRACCGARAAKMVDAVGFGLAQARGAKR
ncbi:hypothetical protein [Gordonia terrae]|uniref:hypothetical protein n=1 Tax=Gordonia terrae TaxID=2055 RepID=UPI00117EB9FD|nr:hypothetical protein [Gordonia terrae]